MDVAHRPGDLSGWQVQDVRLGGRIEITGAARLDLGVAALIDERRQPSDFELAPDDNQQIGTLQAEDETRLRLDEVRVLLPA
jgi:hypothetical protein